MTSTPPLVESHRPGVGAGRSVLPVDDGTALISLAEADCGGRLSRLPARTLNGPSKRGREFLFRLCSARLSEINPEPGSGSADSCGSSRLTRRAALQLVFTILGQRGQVRAQGMPSQERCASIFIQIGRDISKHCALLTSRAAS
jgi:hypothetical protein